MALQEMIVSSAQGNSPDVAKFPYEFYAKETGSTNIHVIHLVMPLGGKENGLFRYPKDGETILVDDDGADSPTYYLMGYLPNDQEKNNFFPGLADANTDEKNALKKEAGMVLRYEQTGKRTSPGYDASDTSERYSEIGFYHRPTQWEPSQKDMGSYNDFDAVKTGIPRIDHLNVQSSGDIHSKAANHHRTKAKRIEILSDVNESDFSAELSGRNRPFGDKGADVSELLQGDIHIRGKRRIVLKAGSEIRLEVGRSTIVISDAGIILTSRKTHSDINNSLDSVLSVLPRDGITMFGQHLKLAAAYDWAIKEGMGSSIKGTAGIMRLEGKDIKASTISGVAYITNCITQTADFVNNLVSMSVGTHDADNVKGSKIPSYVGTGLGVAGILINEGIGLKYPNTGADDDPDSKLAKYSVLVLQLMGTVLFVIESLYINPEDKKAKDALALAGIIAEWGLLLMVFSAICAASVGPYMIYNDTVHLGNNGDITLLGLKIANFAADKQIVNSPLTGGGNFLPERGKWYERLLDFIKDHWWQLGLGVLGIAGAGVGAKFTVDKMNSLSEEQEKLLGELNEL